MKAYHYKTDCVSSRAKDIIEMVDNSREVTYETLRKHCEGISTFFGTSPHIKNDWAVRFYKSKFKGKPCYYVDHSAIEYIWTKS